MAIIRVGCPAPSFLQAGLLGSRRHGDMLRGRQFSRKSAGSRPEVGMWTCRDLAKIANRTGPNIPTCGEARGCRSPPKRHRPLVTLNRQDWSWDADIRVAGFQAGRLPGPGQDRWTKCPPVRPAESVPSCYPCSRPEQAAELLRSRNVRSNPRYSPVR
jgi:hypothetical protein